MFHCGVGGWTTSIRWTRKMQCSFAEEPAYVDMAFQIAASLWTRVSKWLTPPQAVDCWNDASKYKCSWPNHEVNLDGCSDLRERAYQCTKHVPLSCDAKGNCWNAESRHISPIQISAINLLEKQCTLSAKHTWPWRFLLCVWFFGLILFHYRLLYSGDFFQDIICPSRPRRPVQQFPSSAF